MDGERAAAEAEAQQQGDTPAECEMRMVQEVAGTLGVNTKG